jgi:hypothetical protein
MFYFVHFSGMEAACMRKRNRRPPCRKIVLKLPDLDHAKSAVLRQKPASVGRLFLLMEAELSEHIAYPLAEAFYLRVPHMGFGRVIAAL